MEELELELKEEESTHKLTPKQEKFCQEFIHSLNQTDAYIKAYGVDYKTATKIASRLMGNVGVKARIRELQQEQTEKYSISLGFLIEKQLWALQEIVKGKKVKAVTKDGEVVDTGEIEYDFRAYNQALKNMSDFTGINVQTIKAQVEAKTDVKIVSAHDVAKSILDITPESEKVDDLIDA